MRPFSNNEVITFLLLLFSQLVSFTTPLSLTPRPPQRSEIVNLHLPALVKSQLSSNTIQPFITTIQSKSIVEVKVDAEVQLGVITSVISKSKVGIMLDGEAERTVDLGQIITVYDEEESSASIKEAILTSSAKTALSTLSSSSVDEIENGLETVWKRYRKRKGGKDKFTHKHLTKKELNQLDPEVAEILRNAYKRDTSLFRSLDATLDLFPKKSIDTTLPSQTLATATFILSDSRTGGRFKRLPCFPLSHDSNSNSILVLNGGWLANDENMRQTNEASKFAQRNNDPAGLELEASDESILSRMEFLAMGSDLKLRRDDASAPPCDDVGVKEALKKLGLPVTPKGAKAALVMLNRWSEKKEETQKEAQVSPWSEATIQSSQNFIAYAKARRKVKSMQQGKFFPNFTIDTKKTAFRDDAVGIQPRRKENIVNGNKFELVISITDVSAVSWADIDTSQAQDERFSKEDAETLKKAAQARCMSRYDLPFGPLHLLPPPVLGGLSIKEGDKNECVSVIVYLDEKTGEVIDARVERSLILAKTLSYEEANGMLEGTAEERGKSEDALMKIEALLESWQRRRILTSAVSKQRSERLASRSERSRTFARSRAHCIVDSSLDLYSTVATKLLREKKAPVCRMPGSGVNKGGRLATGPLRRWVDMLAQRQLLAVLVGAGKVMSAEECRAASERAGRMRNAIAASRFRGNKD
ncbi:hypothetical protein TrVE_jg11169 [Triparma verrucosa]|uniref:RNB domain-containing protein n=1 Tax=Triparma verrucosa TaxID=1606542 RepID=A0A9W7ENC6_9STRA|nr:hypothetical protein TrVE_jg11169 [Triparma verrucosa]